MSKRRGKVLKDPESVERRKWYNDLQSNCVTAKNEYENIHTFSREVESLQQFESNSDDVLDKVNDRYNNCTPRKWIHTILSPTYAKQNIICFHGIGHNQSYFKKWSGHLKSLNVGIYSICLSEHVNRQQERLNLSIVQMANYIYVALKKLKLASRQTMENTQANSVPLVLFGHCFGALVAYEVARLLVRGEVKVKHLLISSAVTPLLQTRRNRDRRGTVKYHFASDRDLLRRMDELNGVLNRDFLRSRNDLLRRCVDVVRRDYALLEKYTVHLLDDAHYDSGSVISSVAVSAAASVAGTGRSERQTNQSTHNSSHRSLTSTTTGSPTRGGSTARNSVVSAVTATSLSGSRAQSRRESESKQQRQSSHHSQSQSPSRLMSSNNSCNSSYHDISGSDNEQEEEWGGADGEGTIDLQGVGSDWEDEDNSHIPTLLFRLPLPITTLRCSDDHTVSSEDISEWSELTTDYNHLEITASSPLAEESLFAAPVSAQPARSGHNYLSRLEHRLEVLQYIVNNIL